MAVARRSTGAAVAFSAQIRARKHSGSHDSGCTMGPLDSAAWQFGAYPARGISNAPGASAWTRIGECTHRCASIGSIAYACSPDCGRAPTSPRAYGCSSDRCCTPGPTSEGPTRPGASAIGAAGANFGARAGTANGAIALTTQIAANRQTDPRIARSQRAANPVSRGAHATGDDVAWWRVLT